MLYETVECLHVRECQVSSEASAEVWRLIASQTYFFKHMLLAVGCTVTSMQTLVANRMFECTAVFDDIFAAVSLPADKVRRSRPCDPMADAIGEMTAPSNTATLPS